MSMKKLLACLLALMMALALVACGGDTFLKIFESLGSLRTVREFAVI